MAGFLCQAPAVRTCASTFPVGAMLFSFLFCTAEVGHLWLWKENALPEKSASVKSCLTYFYKTKVALFVWRQAEKGRGRGHVFGPRGLVFREHVASVAPLAILRRIVSTRRWSYCLEPAVSDSK